jgi:hypothetical protein
MKDWTTGDDGRSNSSEAFQALVEQVARLLANHRLGDEVRDTARVIVAQLAHVHGLAPTGRSRRRLRDGAGCTVGR